MDFVALTGFSIVQLSLIIIGVAVAIILVSVIAFVVLKRKNKDERSASHVLKALELAKQGKLLAPIQQEKKVLAKEDKVSLKSDSSNEKSLAIEGHELPLKKMLVEKFKPIIEKQLKTTVSIIDFNAKENSFLALVDIGGVRLLLVLDSAGRISDYKKVK